MGGWHLRMTWGQEVCYTSQWTRVRTELANNMVTTGEAVGWLVVERWQLCLRDTFRSAKCHWQAAMGHWISLCMCSFVGWLIVYQLGILSLSCSQYSQTICWWGWDDNACLGVRNCCFKDKCLENKTIEMSTSWSTSWHYVYRKIGLKYYVSIKFYCLLWYRP